jgi:hypothetical protein
MHQDGGNTGSSAFPDPLGFNTTVKTYSTNRCVLLWGVNGTLTAEMTYTTTNGTIISLAAINADTLEVETFWDDWVPASPKDALKLAYGAWNTKTD